MARDLIVLAEDWGGLPTSTQHIIRNLPGKRRILWVNSVGLRRPRLTRHDISRLVTKAKEILLRKQSSHKEPDALTDGIPEGMKVMSPRVYSVAWSQQGLQDKSKNAGATIASAGTQHAT